MRRYRERSSGPLGRGGIGPAETFYKELLNRKSGPRPGPYLHDLGMERLDSIRRSYLVESSETKNDV